MFISITRKESDHENVKQLPGAVKQIEHDLNHHVDLVYGVNKQDATCGN